METIRSGGNTLMTAIGENQGAKRANGNLYREDGGESRNRVSGDRPNRMIELTP
ncbi:MAG: hypothetical protein ACFE0J_01525 [Elainellaceae cyanobacterium]